MNIAFITSTGRTGTDFFTTLFNEYINNAWSLHEPKPAFRRRSHHLISRKPTLYEKYYFKLPRLNRHRKKTGVWYVETNYHLAACIPFLRSVFPESLIIHLIRDGREVVTSWLNKYRYITNDHLLPEHVGDKNVVYKWGTWNPLQKLSWYWKTLNTLAWDNHPDLWIRFEDIFREDQEGICRVLDLFEDISYNTEDIKMLLDRKVNRTQNRLFPDYNDWPPFWKEQFWEIAGDAMKRFGYSE